MELDATRAKWRQIYAQLVAQIESGELAPGAKVPSVMELQERYGVAVATAQKVMRALKAEGLVRTEPGIGTFVVDRRDA